MFHGKNYKTWENAQQLICHSDLPSQIASLKKAIDKGIFFCFHATFRTSHEDTRTSRCCWWHKFATKALLCNTQYFYTVDSDAYFNNAQGMHCSLATATMVTRTHHNITLSVNWPSLMANGIIMKRQSKFHLPFRILYNSLSFNCHTVWRFIACNFIYTNLYFGGGGDAKRGVKSPTILFLPIFFSVAEWKRANKENFGWEWRRSGYFYIKGRFKPIFPLFLIWLLRKLRCKITTVNFFPRMILSNLCSYHRLMQNIWIRSKGIYEYIDIMI